MLSILDDASSAALLKVLRQAAAAGSQSRVKKGKRPAGKGVGKAKAQRQQSPDVAAAEEVQREAGSQNQAVGSSQGDATATEQLTPEVCRAMVQVRNLQGLQHVRWLHSDCDAAAKPRGDEPSGPSHGVLPSSNLHCPCLFCFGPNAEPPCIKVKYILPCQKVCTRWKQGIGTEDACFSIRRLGTTVIDRAEVTPSVMQVLSNLAALLASFGLHGRRGTVKSLIETLAAVTRAPSCAGKLAAASRAARPLQDACACCRRRLQDVACSQICLHDKCANAAEQFSRHAELSSAIGSTQAAGRWHLSMCVGAHCFHAWVQVVLLSRHIQPCCT